MSALAAPAGACEVTVRGQPYKVIVSGHAIARWNRAGVPKDTRPREEIVGEILEVIRSFQPVFSLVPPGEPFTIPAASSGRWLCLKVNERRRELVLLTVLSEAQNRYRAGICIPELPDKDLEEYVFQRVQLHRWARAR